MEIVNAKIQWRYEERLAAGVVLWGGVSLCGR